MLCRRHLLARSIILNERARFAKPVSGRAIRLWSVSRTTPLVVERQSDKRRTGDRIHEIKVADFHNGGVRALKQADGVATSSENSTTTVDAGSCHLRSFDQLEMLDERFKKILKRNCFDQMTEIQDKTWDAIFAGKDVIGRSKTGTGKTLAFLLPSLQRLMLQPPKQQQQQQQHLADDEVLQQHPKIKILIVSPTRELAQQSANQVRLLIERSSGAVDEFDQQKRFSSLVLFGGLPKQRDVQKMEMQIPTILMATPGRLKDHFGEVGDVTTGTMIAGRPFRDYLNEVDVLVLDEVDRLLEMGFYKDIREIISYLPTERQTLVFSATIPMAVQRLVVEDQIIKSDHVLVDCITDAAASALAADPFDAQLLDDDDDAKLSETTAPINPHTSALIEQSHVMLPPDRLVSGIVQIILSLMEQPQHKVLVFFTTTSQVMYFSNLFQLGLGRPVFSMHSKKTQNARAVTSEAFREAREGVLFTSDVSARGLDYPNVTTVVQIGVPVDRNTYIHRLGRTGRAGKEGKGLLVLLMEPEKAFLEQELEDLDIPVNQRISDILEKPLWTDLDFDLMCIAQEMREGHQPELLENAEEVYRNQLGYYTTRLKGFLGTRNGSSSKKGVLVETINSMAAQCGLYELPAITDAQAKQMGLFGNPGLNVHARWTAGQSFDVGRRKGRVEGRVPDGFPPTVADKPVDMSTTVEPNP